MSRMRIWLLLCWGLLWAVPALAQAETAPATEAARTNSPPAAVSFVDERPLTVNEQTLASQHGLRVLIHNDLATEQSAWVRVVGLDELEDPGARELLSGEAPPLRLKGGEIKQVTIPLGSGTKDAKPGTYQLLLAAYGQSGSVAHRTLSVSVGEEASSAEEIDRGSALSPSTAQDVTLVAVNYLPSLLSGLSWLALIAGILAGILAFVIWGALSRVQILAVAVAVLLAAVAVAVGAFNDDLSGGKALHAISSRPIAVTPDSHQGTVGTPSGEEGELIRLQVAGGQMRPQDLSHAGTYKGSYDLAPKVDEKGKAEATVAVRDWWPYAVLAIAFGVGIGYLLRRWYKHGRPAAKLGVRRDKLKVQIAEEDTKFAEAAQGTPYARFTVERRLRARFAEIDRMIEEEDDKAGDSLGDLKSYLGRVGRVREILGSLWVARQNLKQQFDKQGFGLTSVEDVSLFDVLDRELKVTIDSDELDSDESQIKTAQTNLEATQILASRAEQVYSQIALHLAAAEAALDDHLSDEDKKKLGALVESFKGFGRQLLESSKLEEVEQRRKDDEGKLPELNALLKKPQVDGAISASEHRMFLPAYVAPEDTPEGEFDQAALEGERSRAKPTIEGYTVVGAPGAVEPAIHKEDEVELKLSIPAAEDKAFSGVQVDFGDGEPAVARSIPLGGNAVELLVSHTMATPGDHMVNVTTLPKGTEVATLPLAVDASSRLHASEAALKRTERLMGRIALVFAVGSGLVALYITNAAWGTPADYLKAALWGGLGGEGVKYAIALADKSGPEA